MFDVTLETQSRRINNLNSAEQNNKRYLRRHRVMEYMPGQVTYNLGDYPAKFSIAPTEYDYNLIKDLAANGVELIQIHEEWNDSIRHHGADKYSSFDPQGLKAFVELCHSFGIKVIPYISTGYFQVTDPDFREDFVRGRRIMESSHFKYIKCWAGSPTWRQYLLPRMFSALDEYGFDGIYNDWGYDGSGMAIERALKNGGDVADIQLPYDPEIEDLLVQIYTEIKRRGGVYKLHADLNNAPNCKDKVYDYLWIGEGVKDNKFGVGKHYAPYVVPCRDGNHSTNDDIDYYFAKVIPFMQFPLLKYGRPLTGRGIDEDIEYTMGAEYDFRLRIKKYMAEHPQGPYVYSLWSTIPDNPEEYPKWCHYLSLYKPMVTPNSVIYIELRDSKDIISKLPEQVYATMFVNENKYLAVSNLTQADYVIKLKNHWKDRVNGIVSNNFLVKSGTILFLVEE